MAQASTKRSSTLITVSAKRFCSPSLRPKKGAAPKCYDTDPINATFTSWKALNLHKIDIAVLLYIRVGKDFTVVDVPPLFATL
jgi:hypothetical protein